MQIKSHHSTKERDLSATSAVKHSETKQGVAFDPPTPLSFSSLNSSFSIQPKLKIGRPDDRYEREADKIAEDVVKVRGPLTPESEKPCEKCEEEKMLIQRKQQTKSKSNHSVFGKEALSIRRKPLVSAISSIQAMSSGGELNASAELSHQLVQSHGRGKSLPDHTRSHMEAAFGVDFSGVRIHTGREAAQMNQSLQAKAFTHGSDIYFNQGEYTPNNLAGKKLLAHELTHVVQQKKAPIKSESNAIGQITEEAGSGIIQRYSADKAVAYARQWAFKRNPKYAKYDSDCTNFVSQAMYTGGWQMREGYGYCTDRKKDYAWWHKKGGCKIKFCSLVGICWHTKSLDNSYTWAGAQNFYNFVKRTGRGKAVNDPLKLNLGDVIQADWDRNGNISHTMIVTKKTDTNIYLTYHSTDRLDKPFYPEGSDKGVYGYKPNAHYYYWNMSG